MPTWTYFALTILMAYLAGSIPTGFLVARFKGIDIRQSGSGNIGATNCFRVLGKAWGTFVLAFDIFKGALPVMAVATTGWSTTAGPGLAVAAAVAVVLGHNYTCWLRFKGGKGIATSAGALLALMPLVILILVAVFLVAFLATRIVSVGSLAAACTLPITTWFIYRGTPQHTVYFILTALLGLMAIWKHKANIVRLYQGTENRFGKKKEFP